MTEFETQNTVDVVVDDRSLTEARADVEEALSSVPMDVQAEVSGGAGGGSEVAARDRARQRQLLTDQTSSINELRETFEEGDTMSEWQEEHDLSRERNRLLEQLVDAREEGNFDRAARAGGGLLGGGAAILGAGAILGVGALSSVLSNFSWPSLPEFSWPDLPDLEPPGPPGWVPIDVEEPTEPYPVEEPGEIQVRKPDWTPIDVVSPEPDSISSADPSSSNNQVPGGAILAGGAAGGIALSELIRQGGLGAISRGGSAASGGAFLTPEGLGVTDPEQQNQWRKDINRRTPLELPKIPEDKYQGSVFTAEGRQAQVEGLQSVANRIEEALSNFFDGNTSDNDDNPQQRNDIRIESNVTVDGATRREVERAAEEAKRDALREFNREISGGRVR